MLCAKGGLGEREREREMDWEKRVRCSWELNEDI